MNGVDRSDIITLIGTTYIKDDLGQEIEQELKKEAYCNVKSIGMSEWFNAGRNGMKPQYKITMFVYDYDNEKFAEYKGKRYAIYRTYVRQNELIELYLEEKIGV